MKKVKYSIFLRLLGIILFIYVLSKINLTEALFAFKGMSATYFLLTILAVVFGFLVRTLKWQLLANAVGAAVLFKDLIRIMVKGAFLGTITPAKVGEFWRAKYLAETTSISGGKALYTAFIDRLIDLLVIGITVVCGLIVFSYKFGGFGGAWEIIALVFIILVFSSFFLLKKIGLQKILKFFVRFLIPANWKEKTDGFLNQFDQGLASLNFKIFLKILG